MANEKRLMDEFKSELMSKFIDLCRGNDYNKLTLLRIGETIDRIYEKYSTLPSTEDAEVVRCEGCNYSEPGEVKGCYVCHHWSPFGEALVPADGYCFRGDAK